MRPGQTGGCGGPGRRTRPSTPQLFGQDAPTESVTCLVDCPLIQETMPFQKDPEPTAAGIRSDPSNRNVAFWSWRSSTDSFWIGSATLATSRFLLAEAQPPSLAFSFAHSFEARNAWNACTSGR